MSNKKFIKNIKTNKKIILYIFFILIFVNLFIRPCFSAINSEPEYWKKCYNQETMVAYDTEECLEWVNNGRKGSDPIMSGIAQILGWVIMIISSGIGLILTVIIKVLLIIVSQQNFINVETVSKGWTIVRDLCNMFFILVLLLIAFATILRIENYKMKQWLPKLIIMAVLINFSKTICGLIIDFAQVIMLTFVNSFIEGGAARIVDVFQINKFLSVEVYTKARAMGAIDVVLSLLAGLFALIVTLIVMIVFTVILAIRIVLIWVYVILSPLAFLLSAFPQGQQYASKWWSEFTKQVIIGPILAFFLFLALTTASTSVKTFKDGGQLILSDQNSTLNQATRVCASANQFFCDQNLTVYIITICLLIGGLMVSQQMGGVLGSIAGKGYGKVLAAGGLGYAIGKRATKGAVSGATGLATYKMSQSQGLTNALGSLGGGNIPILRTLATKSLTGLNAKGRNAKEKAQQYINNIDDTRILQRMANQRTMTPWQNEVKKAARNKAPSQIRDNAERMSHYSNMSRDEFNKLNYRELAQMGQERIDLTNPAYSELRNFLGTSRTGRKAYNEGVLYNKTHGGGVNDEHWARGQDRNGNDTPDLGFNQYGGAPVDFNNWATHAGFDFDPAQTRYVRGHSSRTPGTAAPAINQFKYWRKNTGGSQANVNNQDDENKPSIVSTADNKIRGNGNLSVNDFARGRANTVAVDFDKLNIKEMDTNGKYNDIKGVNTSDRTQIGNISQKMVGLIDDEITQLSAKGGNDNKLKLLHEAREKFSHPENIDNLSMVNSSAEGYTAKDVARARVHEELHGYGVEDEVDTENLADKAVKDHKTKETRTIAESYKTAERRNPDDILGYEKNDTYDFTDSSSDGSGASLSSGTQKTDSNTSSEIKNLIQNLKSSSSVTPESYNDLSYQFSRLIKAINEQGEQMGDLGKGFSQLPKINVNPTPLEVNLLADKINKETKQI